MMLPVSGSRTTLKAGMLGGVSPGLGDYLSEGRLLDQTHAPMLQHPALTMLLYFASFRCFSTALFLVSAGHRIDCVNC